MPIFLYDNDRPVETIRRACRNRLRINGKWIPDRPREMNGRRRRVRTPAKEYRLRIAELRVMRAIKKCNRKLRRLYKELAEVRTRIIRDKED